MFGECHAHLMMNGYDFKGAVRLHKEEVNIESIHQILKNYKDHGVTFIRDGGDKYGVSKAAMKIAPDYGIDYRTPIFAIHKKGYYGSIVGRSFETMKDFQNLVEEAKSEGCDFIKIMISGIMDFNEVGKLSCPALPEKDIKEMIHIAHSYGLSVMAHANGDDAVLPAVLYGVDSIEHGNFISIETIEEMSKRNTIYVPTAVTIVNLLKSDRFPETEVNKIIDCARQSITHAYQSGVTLALGSDAGAFMVDHGQGIEDEYEFFLKILGNVEPNKEKIEERLHFGETEVKRRFQRS